MAASGTKAKVKKDHGLDVFTTLFFVRGLELKKENGETALKLKFEFDLS